MRGSPRIVNYVVALLLTSVLFIAGGLITWKARNYWEKQVRQIQVDSIQFAQEYRAAFQELNAFLLGFRLTREPVLRTRFFESAAALSRQLAEQARGTAVPESQEILRQLMDEFALY